jgi:hypothetical protein
MARIWSESAAPPFSHEEAQKAQAVSFAQFVHFVAMAGCCLCIQLCVRIPHSFNEHGFFFSNNNCLSDLRNTGLLWFSRARRPGVPPLNHEKDYP